MPAGSWSVFGVKLPEFGWTENIAKTYSQGKTTDLSDALTGKAKAQEAPQQSQGQVQGTNTDYLQQLSRSLSARPISTGGGGGIPTTRQQIPNNQVPYQNIQQQQDNGNSQIDQEYEIAMGALAGQEQGLRSQADTAGQIIGNEAAATRTQLGQEQSTKEQSANQNLQTAETQAKSAMQQARDVFRQTQQSNIAQLSALGISSSSVSEALAERLGVETARRIAGVTGSIDEVRQNTSQELGRIKNYFSEKMTQVQQQSEIQKSQIQQALLQGLNQINSARQQAASDKAAARSNLLAQVQNQLGQLAQQEQQFRQSMEQWAQQKAAALTPIVQDPNYVNNLIAQAQNMNQQFKATGFVATPSFNYNQQGNVTGQISMQKQPKDDPLAELYAQAGIQ